MVHLGHARLLRQGFRPLLIGGGRRGGDRDRTARVGDGRTPRVPAGLEARDERAVLREKVVPLGGVVLRAGRGSGEDHEHERSRAVH